MTSCPFCAEPLHEAADRCPSCQADILRSDDRQSTEESFSPGCRVMMAVAVVLAVSLVAWLVPAVQQAREAARSSTCRSHLKQIGLAIHNYHDTYGSLPPAYLADENGRPMHSWRVLILPYMGRSELYAAYDFSQPWDSPANRFVLENMPWHFACPSSSDGESIYTNYAAVTGPNTIFEGAAAVTWQEFTDVPKNTLMIGEVRGERIPWTSPQDVNIAVTPQLDDPGGFSSHHPKWVQFVRADGGLSALPKDMPQATFQALCTPNGGEEVETP